MSLVSGDYVRLMARYNAWQNKGLRDMLQAMPEEELTRDRGAFFGSILGTANHLLWADQLWMGRFEAGPPPPGGIAESTALTANATDWASARYRMDGRIRAWAQNVREIDLTGPLSFTSVALGKRVTQPMGRCVAHFFNHQTHHRGQLHGMLTAAGQAPGDTDLFLMPDSI
jgi:uncharacterized damage-inducible protein DinB